MEFKVRRHPKNTIYSILMAGIISAAIIVFSPTGVRGEAASNLLGRYSCSKAKELIETNPLKLFNMWLTSGELGSNSKSAQYIAKMLGKSDSYYWIAKHTDVVNGLIEGVEEAAYGSPEKASKVLAKLFITQTIKKIGTAAAGGGAVGIVYTIGEELYQFADDLTAEMVDINVRNITAAVLGEHPVTGKPVKNNGKPIYPNPSLLDLDYFITNYLGWDGEKFKRYNYDEGPGIREMAARRGGLVDYGGRKLNLNIIGSKNTLEGWSINEVRTVSHILLKDVKEQIEKKRKFMLTQGKLRNNLEKLKQEQAILTTFQGLTQQILSMTCQDSSMPCMDAYNSAQKMMEGVYHNAGDNIRGIPSNTLDDLKESVNSLYGNMERMDTILQTDYKSGIQGYCTKIKAGLSPLIEGISQVKAVTAEIAVHAAQAKTFMDTACAATSLSVAKDAAEMARNTADQAVLLFNTLPVLPVFEQPAPPPDPIDFSGREGELSIAEEKIKKYKKIIEESSKKKQAFKDQVRVTRNGLKYMISECKKDRIKGMDLQANADLMEKRIKETESDIPDIEYQKMFIDGLSSKLEAIRWHLTSLKGQNQSHRECLDNLPDSQAMVAEFNGLLEAGKIDVSRANQSAANAADCYDSLKQNSPCNADADCAPGYVCHNDKCVDPKAISCQPNGNCPKGYVCSDTGVCVLSDGGSLFGTLGGEDSQTDQSNLFGTTGGTTTADDLFSTSGGQKTATGSSLFSSAGGAKKQAHTSSQKSEENKLKNQCSQILKNISTALDRGDTKSAQNFTNSAFALGCDIDTKILAQVENIEKRTKEQREQELANITRKEEQRDEDCLKIRTGILSAITQKNVEVLQNLVGISADMGCDENTAGINQIIAKIKAEKRQQQQAQQQAQINRPQQSQNQTNWMDVMTAVINGVQGVQQMNNSKPSSGSGSRPASGNNSSPFPTRTDNGMDPGAGSVSSSGNTVKQNNCGRKIPKQELASLKEGFGRMVKQWSHVQGWYENFRLSHGRSSYLNYDRYQKSIKIWKNNVNCWNGCAMAAPKSGAKSADIKRFYNCRQKCFKDFKYDNT